MAGFCPSYEAAVEAEQLDRSKAFIGEPEAICGLPVNPLTPFLWDVLISKGSPYANGGKVTCAAILQFLWIVSPGFKPGCGVPDNWLESTALQIDYIVAAGQIGAFIARTFMDAPDGSPSTPYYPLSVSVVHHMSGEPYRWSMKKTQRTAYRIIFPLLRAHAKSEGCIITNKSDDKMGDALDEVQRMMDAGEWTQEVQDRVNGVKREGVAGGR